MTTHSALYRLQITPVILALHALVWLSYAGNAAQAATPQVDYNRDVRPILSDKCYQCHGPDAEARQGDLRLDRREAAEHVLGPDAEGQPSELARRITSEDPDEQMPPADAKLQLTAGEIVTLQRWVEQGAPYAQHWSFQPIEPVTVPDVAQTEWPRNEIDRFILARLEREQLAPSHQASQEKLIRRLSFDLSGLPPTLAEIDQFLADDSADAYVALVDRILAKPAYGERMASDWMDVARYSDTYGYQVDKDRRVWPWRDWVIEAFNENMPFDRFITWQLAGDALPDASDRQVLATTFNRLHPQKVEGGSTPEEFRVEYVADRNHTFATAFLGLTLECARCHDHKYDPILQQEYYQLFAFFNNIDEAGLYSYRTPAVPTPTLLLTDDEMKRKISAVEQRIAAAAESLAIIAGSADARFADWLAIGPPMPDIPGRIAHLGFEGEIGGGNRGVPGHVGQAIRLSGDDLVDTGAGNFRRFEPFSVSLWLNTPDVKQRAVVFHRSGGWTDNGSRGYQLLIEEGRLSWSLIHFWPGNAIRVRTSAPVPTNEWLHVAVTSDGSSRAAGLQIYIDGQSAECDVIRDHLHKEITGGGGDNIRIGARDRDRGFTDGMVDEFQVFERQLSPVEVAQLHGGRSLTEALATPADQLTEVQRSSLMPYFLMNADPQYLEGLEALQSVRAERSDTVDGITEIMVMRDLPQRRPTYLLKRGAYDAPTVPVFPQTPAVFPPLPDDAPRNRLGLAQWLTDPGHPLTARVMVNRVWQMCLGRGLVETPEDFGSQGKPPTHPLLLDWLARDFIDHDWDVQRLLTQIVTSATYRQSSRLPAPPLSNPQSADPDNRLLARGPTYRLPAEMLRDNALAVSGLLVDKIGGPPVRPYELTESFKPVEKDTGEGLYRRSLYTYWKRTAPAPAMMALDASKRDICTVKRERTASPLQALVLLNDPQFVEAARLLAGRMLQEHGAATDPILTDMFRLLTSRRPNEQELSVLREMHAGQLDYFEQHPDAAVEFLQVGDTAADDELSGPQLAALAVVANALLNYDECVMKR